MSSGVLPLQPAKDSAVADAQNRHDHRICRQNSDYNLFSSVAGDCRPNEGRVKLADGGIRNEKIRSTSFGF